MNAATMMFRAGLLSAAIALVMLPRPGSAQDMDHSRMKMPPAATTPPAQKPATKKPAAKAAAAAKKVADPHAGHAMPAPTSAPTVKPQPTAVDHAAMGHTMPKPVQADQAQPMDHSAMDHSAMDHSAMDHSAMDHDGMPMAPTEPREPIPVLTDADRAAAAPPPGGHMMAHDNAIQSFVVFNRLEGWNADNGIGVEWEGQGWIGTDLDRLWLRSEGERVDGRIESAYLEVLYGRSVARWWDVVAGIRHDFKPGAAQDFAAIGVVGLAPYKFEVAATAYIGHSGQTVARLEVEYETLLTNRLILQPLVEVSFFGQDDERRGIGSGLSTVEVGLRLRYEFTRQFAPYIGVVRERAFGRTADFHRDEGEDIDHTRFVAGLRIWF